jgi:hypothetical protein
MIFSSSLAVLMPSTIDGCVKDRQPVLAGLSSGRHNFLLERNPRERQKV